MSGARITGVQGAQVAIAQLVHGWREQMAPLEYVVLVDLLSKFLDAERERLGQSRVSRRHLGTGEGS